MLERKRLFTHSGICLVPVVIWSYNPFSEWTYTHIRTHILKISDQGATLETSLCYFNRLNTTGIPATLKKFMVSLFACLRTMHVCVCCGRGLVNTNCMFHSRSLPLRSNTARVGELKSRGGLTGVKVIHPLVSWRMDLLANANQQSHKTPALGF